MYKVTYKALLRKPFETLLEMLNDTKHFDKKIAFKNMDKVLYMFKKGVYELKAPDYRFIFNKGTYITEIDRLIQYVNYINTVEGFKNIKDKPEKWESKYIKVSDSLMKKIQWYLKEIDKLKYPQMFKLNKVKNIDETMIEEVLDARYDRLVFQMILLSRLLSIMETNESIKAIVKSNWNNKKYDAFMMHIMKLIKKDIAKENIEAIKERINTLTNKFEIILND